MVHHWLSELYINSYFISKYNMAWKWQNSREWMANIKTLALRSTPKNWCRCQKTSSLLTWPWACHLALPTFFFLTGKKQVTIPSWRDQALSLYPCSPEFTLLPETGLDTTHSCPPQGFCLSGSFCLEGSPRFSPYWLLLAFQVSTLI